jgi:Dolichyl-phosphate-mannose-protein mannosyltransferase
MGTSAAPASTLRQAAPASFLREPLRLALVFAAVKLAIQIAINLVAPHFGYNLFRDELYYIDCGRHLAWGYVDHAPMVALQARIADTLFGHTHLWAFRLISGLAGAGMVFLTGLLAWSMGGGKNAQILAMLGSIAAVVNLPLDGYLSMNSFEPVFWMTAMLSVILIARGGSPRWWLLFGLASGLGLENKHTEAFFLLALLIALLLSPQRKLLRSRCAAACIGLIFALALPNLLWEWLHHFPTWEWLQRISHFHKNVVLGPGDFLRQQVFVFNPLAFPLWLGGVLWLLFSDRARPFRFAGLAYVIFLPLMYALHAKDYYLAPIYPVYFAAGGVACFALLKKTWQRRVLLPIYVFLFCALAVLGAPAIAPLLPWGRYDAYTAATHLRPRESERFAQIRLPQFLADMTSWPQFTAQMAAAYNALPPDLRARTFIYCGDYGEAGAIDVLGPQYGLPPAISGHMNYWFWGPRGELTDSMLVIGQSRQDVEKSYQHVRQVGRIHTPWSMPDEDDLPIWFATGRYRSIAAIWPTTRNWY